MQRHMVRYIRVTHCAEKYGVVGLQALQPVLRHHRASLAVEVGAPWQVGKLEFQVATGSRHSVQGLLPFSDDLRPNSISCDNCYGIQRQIKPPGSSG